MSRSPSAARPRSSALVAVGSSRSIRVVAASATSCFVLVSPAHLRQPGPDRLLGGLPHDARPAFAGPWRPWGPPSGNRPGGRPRDDPVDAELGGGLDGEFVPVALGQRLHERRCAGRPPRRPCSSSTLERRARVGSAVTTVPRRISPAPLPSSRRSPGRIRLTVTACLASAPPSPDDGAGRAVRSARDLIEEEMAHGASVNRGIGRGAWRTGPAGSG